MGRPAIELRAQHAESRDPQRRRAGRRPLAGPGQSPVGPTASTVVQVRNSALDLSRIPRFFMSRDKGGLRGGFETKINLPTEKSSAADAGYYGTDQRLDR